MLRCNYNVVFFRVLCATLLATAVTFTVILTNVFIDIDWFLSNKNKQNIPFTETAKIASNEYEIIEGPETEYTNNENSYDNEIEPFYRTKRSMVPDSDNVQLHVKDPALKKILTSRLASLLKELDEEELTNENNKPELTTASSVKPFEKIRAKENIENGIKNEDLLHLAMHNILLQGMIGHMDLNDVYKKVHILVNHFNNVSDKNKDKNARVLDAIVNSKEDAETRKFNPYNDEHKFFEELLKCKKLESQIANNEPNQLFSIKNTTKSGVIEKDNKIYIKAVIEINEDNGRHNKINLTNTTKNVEGLIKLIYNGETINVNQVKDTTPTTIVNKKIERDVESITVINEKRNIEEFESKSEVSSNHKQQQNTLLNKLIEEYMKTHSPNYEYLESGAEIKNIKSKRSKRQIKIRYFDDKINNNPKPLHDNTKIDDDDVYIEIETHFDGKGIKGEKKMKLVRSLIDKIEKALHSDIHETNNTEHIKFLKRIQDPIDGNKHTLINKISSPHDRIEQRQLDPIDKTLSTHENILNTIEDSWKDQIESPKFLSNSKSVNSAEMRQLNIEYDTVLKNGIPKRLQKPINTDIDDEEHDATASHIANDLGNVTLLLKDIDGSGFSIGINQYVGEPPDKESMKMFNGLENLIRKYHQIYDPDISNESDIDKANNFVALNNEASKRIDRNGHIIQRRSINDVDNNDNYKILLKNSNLSFEKYLDKFKRSYNNFLFNSKKAFVHKVTKNTSNKNIKKLFKKFKIIKVPIIINRKLKPVDILTLTNFTNRKTRSKRSFIVKKISNVRSKIKLSRFINTNAMASKKIFLKNKRSKRQINRIRIIARDRQDPPKNSDENIFMISRENAYSDKATIIKDFETPDPVIDVKNKDHYDEIYPIGDIYRIHHNAQPMYSDFYDTKRSSNRLMSKYPHIFINDDSGSKEEDFTSDNLYSTNEKPYRIQPKQNTLRQETPIIDTKATVTSEKSIPKVEEIINAIMPPASKANYKLTLKITPKNLSNISTGFKEVHTSVNKSFDENGLRYFSLFNVSQISKIEKLNKTSGVKQEKKDIVRITPINNQLKEQNTQIKTLLQLHKKRVDQQLGNLLRESKHLEKMIEANSKNNINKTINILHDDIIATDVTSDDKMNKILASIKKLQESYNSIKSSVKSEANIATEKQRINTDKPEIIHSIKSNEKVTNEILKRIDINTNILKAFLERFSDNLKSDKKDTLRVLTTENPNEIKLNLAKDWKSYNKNTFYGPDENKNATVPFIYAYQQNKGPLASMVYHGHIHTNALQSDREFNKSPSKIQPNVFENSDINRKFNGSKFFMDEIENDFKVAPNKPFIAANVKINTTNV